MNLKQDHPLTDQEIANLTQEEARERVEFLYQQISNNINKMNALVRTKPVHGMYAFYFKNKNGDIREVLSNKFKYKYRHLVYILFRFRVFLYKLTHS